ncbi:MAG: hypothetical protein ACJ76V_12185 [Thermoleophilaceae bacterium]
MENWQLVTNAGIQIDGDGDVWHSGRCVDLLPMGQGNLLVASESGGVWHVDGTYAARPLSDDWDFPDVVCLGLADRRRGHVFAGCIGGLYETDVSAPGPLSAWRSVPLPPGVASVMQIVVVSEPARLVLATDAGVWWADMGGGVPAWQQALGPGGGAFSGLARGATRGPRGNTVPLVIAGQRDGGVGAGGIWVGGWQSGNLSLAPASIDGLQPGELSTLTNFSLASCEQVPRRAYALAAGPKGVIGRVLRSSDGGEHWKPTGMTIDGADPGFDVSDFLGDVTAGGAQKTISVHPHNPDVVAFGWRPPLISDRAGNSWRVLGGVWTSPTYYDWRSPSLHADIHAIRFDPTYGDTRLYVCSDGGVAKTDNWSVVPAEFTSYPNRELATLQFYSPGPPRDFWGTVGGAPFAPIVGGGLQDNGNVVCDHSVAGPWKRATGGDGGWFACVNHANGQILTNPMGEGVRRAHWTGGGPASDEVIPLEAPVGTLESDGLKGPVAEAIPRPRFKRGGELLYAVGAPPQIYAEEVMRAIPLGLEGHTDSAKVDNHWVFGLFGLPDNPFLEWRAIQQMPAGSGRITAFGADTGDYIFVGTANGEIFVMDPSAGGGMLQLGVHPPSSGLGAVERIVLHGGRGPFAMMESGPGSVILELAGFGWRQLKSSKALPFTKMFGFDVHRGGGPITLAVSTDTDVFVSPDDGDTWKRASGGLPRVPHCCDLRFGTWQERDALFLGTWGRSMWAVHADSQIAPGRRHRMDLGGVPISAVRDADLVRHPFNHLGP